MYMYMYMIIPILFNRLFLTRQYKIETMQARPVVKAEETSFERWAQLVALLPPVAYAGLAFFHKCSS